MSLAQNFIDAQRADTLAQLIFTRISNCTYRKASASEEGFDYLLSLSSSPHYKLGVQVKAVRTPPSDSLEIVMSEDMVSKIERLDVSLLLLVINIVAENAYYGWIKAPVVAPTFPAESIHKSLLVPLKKLSENQLDKLIRRIVSTKTFWVHHKSGAFRAYISTHVDGTVHGMIVPYDRIPATVNTPTTLKFDHRKFRGIGENEVREKIINWINSNIGTEYNITGMEET